VVEPTHLKICSSNWTISPRDRGENKKTFETTSYLPFQTRGGNQHPNQDSMGKTWICGLLSLEDLTTKRDEKKHTSSVIELSSKTSTKETYPMGNLYKIAGLNAHPIW